MDDCPLVRLANNRKILKKFEQTGKVAIPLSDWIRFFEALTMMTRDGQRDIVRVQSLATSFLKEH